MDSFDLIVVGSGPGATFAAYGARGSRILMLDVGFDARPWPEPEGSIYDLRRSSDDLFRSLIGEDFESLRNLRESAISLKLKSPFQSYIVKEWQRLSPTVGASFGGALSLAKGGLANAWGAGVYRFNERELIGYPIGVEDLQPFYNELTAHIGISGANDDLGEYFTEDPLLQPPLRLSKFFADFLSRYERAHDAFRADRVRIGRARLAVLSQALHGRAAYNYSNLEFFRPRDPGIYTPAFTVDEMIAAGAVEYRSGSLVLRFEETRGGVEVHWRDVATGSECVAWCRKLCLGAGAINTARIVLQASGDYETRLPILDNPMACLPFFQLSRIGSASPEDGTSLAQLNLVMEDPDWPAPLQGSIYGAMGPLRSDVIFELPFSIRANMTLMRHLSPAMGLLMLFYPGPSQHTNYLRLRPSGELEVHLDPLPPQPSERRLVRLLRKLGYLTHGALVQRPAPGAGLHFAATLPMQQNPSRYQTDRWGLLSGHANVHVVDGACLSALPSKNLTFTIMANALRIGRHLAAQLR